MCFELLLVFERKRRLMGPACTVPLYEMPTLDMRKPFLTCCEDFKRIIALVDYADIRLHVLAYVVP